MHRIRLEILLILAVVLLIGQLGWPAVARWWRRPSPGTIGVDQFESLTLAENYLIYLPKHYDSQSWPLVAFLHGSGDRGNDATVLRGSGPFALVNSGTELPAIIAAPQCLPNCDWQPDAVSRFIAHVASTYHVDRKRIYLIGYSLGGYGTWRTAAAHPELFAAIVPICGGGEPDDTVALADTPVWAFHGGKDDVVPVKVSERIIESIRVAGGQPRLTVIPDAGHGICESVCGRTDLWDWLFQQNLQDRKNRHPDLEHTNPASKSQ